MSASYALAGSPLGRKLAGRPVGGSPARSRIRTDPPQALGRALARAAQGLMGLALDVREVEAHERASLAELLDMPESGALLCVLEGPEDALGFAALAPDILAGIIQQQTTGTVAPGRAPTRRPTRTDASMSAGLIDRALAEFEAALDEADLGWARGYRYASFLDEARTLGLLLEDVEYRVFLARVGLAHGARKGDILLALPTERPRRARLLVPGPESDAESHAGAWTSALTDAVLGSDARLHAVLTRLTVPLSRAMEWQVGDVVPLPAADIASVSLEGRLSRGRGEGLSAGRLGQSRGFRAVRVEVSEGDVADALEAVSPPRRNVAAEPRLNVSAPRDDAPETGVPGGMPAVAAPAPVSTSGNAGAPAVPGEAGAGASLADDLLASLNK